MDGQWPGEGSPGHCRLRSPTALMYDAPGEREACDQAIRGA